MINFFILVVWPGIEPWTSRVLCATTAPHESKGGQAKKFGYLYTMLYELYNLVMEPGFEPEPENRVIPSIEEPGNSNQNPVLALVPFSPIFYQSCFQLPTYFAWF